jgi:hypothetical protein
MIDREALREALHQVMSEQIEYQPDYFVWQMEAEVRDVIEAAAREFLRLMETGETIQWCEEHHHSIMPLTGRCEAAHNDAPCRMVSAVLTRQESQTLDRNSHGTW